MGRFWLDDEFIRTHAKKLKPSGIAIYVYLASRANREGIAFVSVRRIGEDLGLHVETVVNGLRDLEAFGFSERSKKRLGRVFGIFLPSVRKNQIQAFGNSETK